MEGGQELIIPKNDWLLRTKHLIHFEMRKLKLLLVTLIIYSCYISQAQEKSMVLSNPYWGQYDFYARDSISLKPGFQYSAIPGHSFTARIDESLLFPASYVLPVSADREISTSLQVGAINGSFDVSSTGAATYSIPIPISPGTANMVPQVSLFYNSQAGNGLMGQGWDIAGLSSIARVGKSIHLDTKVTTVELNEEDRFALDGNRLIVTNGFAYGSNGSVYGTEMETFVKVTAHGTAGIGPEWFEVVMKDGQVLEYGRTADSRVEPLSGTTPYMWRLNKIKDVNGNYITYHYREHKGSSVIHKICYTGFEGGDDPYNEIVFKYETRSDTRTSYIRGKSIEQELILYKIETYAEDKKVKELDFQYHYNQLASRLVQITERAWNGDELNSTIVEWGEETAPFEIVPVTMASANNKIFTIGDYNGNGRDEFIVTPDKNEYAAGDKWELFINSNNGESFSMVDEGNLTGHIRYRKKDVVLSRSGVIPAWDYNGDGLSDMLLHSHEISNCVEYCWLDKFIFYQSYGDSLRININNYCIDGYNDYVGLKVIHGDFNGDGLINCFSFPFTETNLNSQYYNFDFYPVDYNGDGITDLIGINQNTNFDLEDACIIFDGSRTPPNDGKYITENRRKFSHTGFPTKWHRIFPGDFNGDRKTDFLTYSPQYGWQLSHSDDNGHYLPHINLAFLKNQDPETTGYYVFVRDVNGDGLSDIVELYEDSCSWYGCLTRINVFYSKGNDAFTSITGIFYFMPPGLGNIYFGDFNGDGKQECFISEKRFFTIMPDGSGVPIISFPQEFDPTIIRFHPNDKSHLVKSITNGLNLKYEVNYKPLTDSTVYTKGENAPFPTVRDLQGPIYVVSSVQQDNGIGGTSSHDYFYEGALFHSLGRGFLGFRGMEVHNNELETKLITTNTLNTSKYIILPHTIERKKLNDQNISKSFFKYSIKNLTNPRFLVSLDSIAETDFLNNVVTSSIIKYDSYGNDTLTINHIGGDVVVETRKQYGDYITGIPNRIVHQSISKKYGTETPYVTETEYEYDSTGNLENTISLPGTAFTVNTNYQYTNRGLLLTETVSSTGLPNLVNQYEYDNETRQRFVTKIINPEGMEKISEYDSKTGNILSQTDYNGHTSRFIYDGFGRLLKTITPRGHQINHSLHWADIPEMPLALYYEETEIPGRPIEKKYYDILGREIRYETEGREGIIFSGKTYNNKGQLISETEPAYLSASSTESFNYQYDAYGRLTSKIFHEDTVSYSYGQGSKTTTNHGSGWSTKEYYNAAGDITKVTDAGGEVNYLYHSSGQMKEVNYGSHVVSMGYDAAGRQDSLNDPSSGIITYQYNAYGQLKEQEDANAITFTMDYDLMGRLTSKTGPDGTTSYNYFTSGSPAHLYGLLTTVTGVNNINETYNYNQYGEITSRVENIQGEAFTYAYQYDNYGNQTQEAYPAGISVINEYNSKGFLQKITKNPGNVLIWEFVSEEKPGMISSYTRGPGMNTVIDYDEKGFPVNYLTSYQDSIFQNIGMDFDHSSGNLLSRQENRRQLTESFQYDNLDRLSYAGVTGGVQLNMDYAPNGNILFKTDAGDYTYHPNKTNAVSGLVNNPLSIPFTDQEIEYTPFNKAWQISEDGKEITITYGPDQQRRKSVYTDGSLERTTIYGINYERLSVPGSTKHSYYLHSPTGLAAIVIKDGSENLYYTLTDHLGSITGLVDATCQNLVEEYSFDAWGRRRNPVDWTYDYVSAPTYLTRGFTGHEHLDAFGLINMNGRMYDPVLARFLSPDNYVQMPFSTQGYNRYSYCINNPLKYSDPDGEWFITALFMLGNAYFNGVMANDMKFNPLKWEPNFNTFLAVGTGLVQGYNFGQNIQSKLNQRKFRNGINQLAVDDTGITYNSNGGIDYSNDSAEKFVDYYFNKFPKESREALINIYADARTIKGVAKYDIDTKSYINLLTNEKGVGGFTVPELNGNSDMYLAETIFRDKFSLYSSIGHELIHVHHNRITRGGLHSEHPLFKFHQSSSEFWAYTYMVDQNNKWASLTKNEIFVRRANHYSDYRNKYFNYNPLFDYNLIFGILINRVP